MVERHDLRYSYLSCEYGRFHREIACQSTACKYSDQPAPPFPHERYALPQFARNVRIRQSPTTLFRPGTRLCSRVTDRTRPHPGARALSNNFARGGECAASGRNRGHRVGQSRCRTGSRGALIREEQRARAPAMTEVRRRGFRTQAGVARQTVYTWKPRLDEGASKHCVP